MWWCDWKQTAFLKFLLIWQLTPSNAQFNKRIMCNIGGQYKKINFLKPYLWFKADDMCQHNSNETFSVLIGCTSWSITKITLNCKYFTVSECAPKERLAINRKKGNLTFATSEHITVHDRQPLRAIFNIVYSSALLVTPFPLRRRELDTQSWALLFQSLF